jgi:RNA polymerase-binding transcription factor DksA
MLTLDFDLDLPTDEALADDPDLRRFHAALLRIERGTFGLCIDCERPIERARLDQMPLAEQCAACSYAMAPARLD